MKLIKEPALTFDDVAIVPRYSTVASRSEVSVGNPIILAGMYTLDFPKLRRAVVGNGGSVFLPRGTEDYSSPGYVPSVSASTAAWFCSANRPHTVTIDTAHGTSSGVSQTVERIKKWAEGVGHQIFIIAGTVEGGIGASTLQDVGADAVRVGVGAGLACLTRPNTGVGRGMITCLMEAREAVGPNFPIYADGGIRKPADYAKALTIADKVIIGYLFANTRECTATRYTGMAAEGEYVEGTSVALPTTNKPSVADVIKSLNNGLRSAMSYTGSYNLKEYREKAILQVQSRAAQYESKC